MTDTHQDVEHTLDGTYQKPTEPPPQPSAEARELAAKLLEMAALAARQAREALDPEGPALKWVHENRPEWAPWAAMFAPAAAQRIGDAPELLDQVRAFLLTE